MDNLRQIGGSFGPHAAALADVSGEEVDLEGKEKGVRRIIA